MPIDVSTLPPPSGAPTNVANLPPPSGAPIDVSTLPPPSRSIPKSGIVPNIPLQSAAPVSTAVQQPQRIPHELYGEGWNEPEVDPLIQAMTQNLPAQTEGRTIPQVLQNAIRDIGMLPAFPVEMIQHPVQTGIGLAKFPFEQGKLLMDAMAGIPEAQEELGRHPMWPLFATAIGVHGIKGAKGVAGKIGRKGKVAPPEVKSAPFKEAGEPAFVKTSKLAEMPKVEAEPVTAPKETAAVLDPGEFAPQKVAIKNIGLKPKEMQFKLDINAEGIQRPLKGEWSELAGGNILLWQDKKGKYYVANGHHRLELAKRQGIESINAQVLKETDGFTITDARRVAAETNILEGRGTVYDHAEYFKLETEYTPELAESKGIKGQGYSIGKFAEDDLYSAFRNRKIKPEQAEAIAESAPNDPTGQRIGQQYVQDNPKADPLEVSAFIEAVRIRGGRVAPGTEQADMFGEVSSAELAESAQIARAVAKDRKRLQEKVTASRSAAKRPEKAGEMGVEVRDVGETQKKIQDTLIESEKLKKWYMDADLVREYRKKVDLEEIPLFTEKATETPKLAEMPKTKLAKELEIRKAAKEYSNNIDPNWEMSDSPSQTKGYRVYHTYIENAMAEPKLVETPKLAEMPKAKERISGYQEFVDKKQRILKGEYALKYESPTDMPEGTVLVSAVSKGGEKVPLGSKWFGKGTTKKQIEGFGSSQVNKALKEMPKPADPPKAEPAPVTAPKAEEVKVGKEDNLTDILAEIYERPKAKSKELDLEKEFGKDAIDKLQKEKLIIKTYGYNKPISITSKGRSYFKIPPDVVQFSKRSVSYFRVYADVSGKKWKPFGAVKEGQYGGKYYQIVERPISRFNNTLKRDDIYASLNDLKNNNPIDKSFKGIKPDLAKAAPKAKPAETPKVKEPWEMTQKEFIKSHEKDLVAERYGTKELSESIVNEVGSADIGKIANYYIAKYPELKGLKVDTNYGAPFSFFDLEKNVINFNKKATPTTVRHEIEHALDAARGISDEARSLGFSKYPNIPHNDFNFAYEHRRNIKQAAERGIIGEGIKDYPDLAKAAPKAKVEAEPVTTPKAEEPIIKNIANEVKEPVQKAKRVVGTLRKATTDVVEFVQNADLRVRQLTERPGVKISDVSDPYMRIVLYHGRSFHKIKDIQKEAGTIFRDIKKQGVNKKDVTDYLYFRHAPERNAVLGEGAAGIKTADAAAKLKQLESSPKASQIKILANRLQDINNQTLDLLYEGGVISKDLHGTLRERYKHHVPLNRIFEETENIGDILSGRGFDVRATGIKRAKGSQREISDITANIISNFEQAVLRSEKNIVDQTTLRFVRDNKDIFGDLFEVITPEVIGKTFKGTPISKRTTDPSILQLYEGGKRVWIKINDPSLAIALRGVGRDKLGSVLNAVGAFTRFYSGLATRFNPEFAVPNKIRDLQETVVYLAAQNKFGFKGALKSLARDPKSIKDVLDGLRGANNEGARLYNEMKSLGGTTGGMALSTRPKVVLNVKHLEKLANSKTRRIAHNLIEYVDNWNEIFENSTRLSAYKQGLAQGLSKDRAAYFAKEASINFNRMGRGGPVINALYMFANASIQGSAKMIRALRNPKVLGATLATVGGAVAAVCEWNDKADSGWRDKVSKWDRLNGLPIVLPGTDDKFRYFTIPVSWGIKPIKVWADYAYDAISGKNVNFEEMVTDGMVSILEAYNPVGGTNLVSALTPTIIDIPVEIGRNQAWTGKKIRPDYDPYAPKDIQYFSSLGETKTGQAAINISETLHDELGLSISPADIKYAYNSYIGGAGRAVTKTVNLVGSLNNPPPLSEYPIISRFYREYDNIGSIKSKNTKELRGLLSEQSRERFILKQQAVELNKEFQELPQKEAVVRYTRLKKTNPQLANKLKDVILDIKSDLTYEEQLIRQLGVDNGKRAKYILKELEVLKTKQEKADYIKNLVEKKIITPDVVKQMGIEIVKNRSK